MGYFALLVSLRQELKVLLACRHGMNDELVAAVEGQQNKFQQRSS